MTRLVAANACVLRTARKPWSCIACNGPIAPHERYLEYLGQSAPYGSGSRYCLICAQHAGLAKLADPIGDALEHLPDRLRRLIDAAPVSLIVAESAGGPTSDELAICKTIVRLLRLARDAERPPV